MMRRLRIAALGAALASAAVAVLPDAALAHGLVGKQDLPIPRWLFAWAAAVVLVVSFVALAVLWPKPRLEDRARDAPVLACPRSSSRSAALIGIAAFAFMVYAGFAGTQAATANIEPTVIYVIFWVGIPFASAVFGDVFAAVQPVARARARRGVGRRARDPRAPPGADGLPVVARPLARGGRDPRLRLGRARLRQPRRPEPPRDPRAALRRDAAHRHERLRHRDVDAPRRRVRRLLQPLLEARAAALARPRPLYRRLAAVGRAAPRPDARARSRCCAR